jgi:transposase
MLIAMQEMEESEDEHQHPVGSVKEARWRAARGLSRELQQERSEIAPHPKSGGSAGYPMSFRVDVMNSVDVVGIKATSQVYGVSRRTIKRWAERIVPFRQTGNKQKLVLTADDQILLTLCYTIYPRSSADNAAAFIFANGGEAYPRQAIYRRLKEMKLKRKKGSVESYDAYTEVNRMKAEIFWTQPPRAGIAGVPRFRLIDIDETHFDLKSTASKYGYALGPVRVRDTAHFKRGDTAINVILAVEPGNANLPDHVLGSVYHPRKWFRITTKTVDDQVFADFVDEICKDIEENPVSHDTDKERIFMWDNLAAHKTPLVLSTMENRETDHVFHSICRPPYQPKFAPIEYIFCQLSTELRRRVKQRWTKENLRDEVHNIILALGWDGSIDRTFRHCGYKRNY